MIARCLAFSAAAALMVACSATETPQLQDQKAGNPNVVVISEAASRFYEGKRLIEAGATGQALIDAVNLLLRASELGSSDAKVLLAKLYQEGRGTPLSPGEAVNLLVAASAQGNATATYELGRAFETGTGVEKNPSEAMKNYLKAAQAKHPNAMFEVARALELGKGVSVETEEAIAWYRRAADAGHPGASDRLKELEAR